jgi:hypothetical protein
VTSIASVADTAEEKFVPYYDLFMPSLKHIVENAVQKELRLLRGKTIECISLIGLAVGKDKVHTALSTRCSVHVSYARGFVTHQDLHTCSMPVLSVLFPLHFVFVCLVKR